MSQENVEIAREAVERWLRGGAGEFIDAGDDVVNVLHETAGAGDLFIKRDLFQVWTFCDGLVTMWRIFETREQALEAVGLRE